MPIIETGFAGLCYCTFTYFNKNLDEKRKPAIMWQNILGCVFGITISKKIDNSINGFRNNLCKEMTNLKQINKVDKVINGVKIAVPLITTATITRIAIPILLVPISTKIEQLRLKHKNKSNIKSNTAQKRFKPC